MFTYSMTVLTYCLLYSICKVNVHVQYHGLLQATVSVVEGLGCKPQN